MQMRELLEGFYRDRVFPHVSALRARLRDGPPLDELIEAARCRPEEFATEGSMPGQNGADAAPTLLGRGSTTKSVTLIEPPVWFRGFIDPSDEADPYPAILWSGFEKYLENLSRLVRSKPIRSPKAEAGGDS